MNQKKWGKRLRTCLCSMLAMTCVLSSIPVTAASGSDNMVEYTNIALGCPYQTSASPNPSYGDGGGELTDGDYGSESLWDGRWVGFSGQEMLDITIDLGSPQVFQGVEAVFLNDVAGGGVNYPEPFTFSWSNDGQDFVPFHTGGVPSDAPENSVYTYTYQGTEEIQAQYVRLSVPASNWVFIGEIRVLQGKQIALPEYNIAEGAGYVSDPEPHSSFPDNGGELTDGFAPPADSYDGGWVGYSGIDGDVNITVDLGSEQEFRGVEALFLRDLPGGGIGYPDTVSFSYSTDGNQFTEYASGQKPSETPDRGLFNFTHVTSQVVKAQYVRLTFPGKYWVSVGEIRILSDEPKTVGPQKPNLIESFEDTVSAVEGEQVTLSVEASVSDGGTLSYQWYKDETPLGTDSSLVIDSATISDSGDYYVEVTNTLDGKTATAKSKTCQLKVMKEGAVAEKPVITTDLDAVKQVRERENVTLSVAASVSDGGTLSYQWYKDGTAVGTNSNTFSIASALVADSGNYKVVVTNSKDGAESTVESTVCALTVEARQNKNILSGLAYETSWSDDTTVANGAYIHDGYPDKGRSKLTDGQKNSEWGAGSNVGYHVTEAPIDITFNFDEEKSFREIQVGSFNDAGPSVLAPYQMKIQAAVDGEWITIFEGETPSSDSRINLVFTTLDDQAITATGLRFELQGKGSWMFLDEIEALEQFSGDISTGYLEEGAEPVNNNLALGVSYETSSQAHESYPDTNGAELTDGKIANTSFYSEAWSAYANLSELSVTLDLGAVKTFEEVRFTSLQHAGAAIWLPQAVSIYTSNDKESWKLVSTDGIGASSVENFIYSFKATMYQPETARYVKVQITPNSSGWFFIDEVEILAKSLDNPDAATNNIAARKPYTSNPAADSAHPDSAALTKLTDGRSGSLNSADSAWVGYQKSGKNTEITINLGAPASFEQVNARFLSDQNNGIYLPTEATVSCSEDGASWKTLGTGSIEAAGADDLLTYTFQYAFEKATAQYVKVSFPADEKILLDEIEVLKNRTVFPEQEPDEVYTDKNNLALNRGYTTSWSASSEYPDAGNELTDGARGSYLYKDAGWSGYETREEEKFSVTVDLGENKSFEQAQVGMLKSTSRLLSIQYPTHIKVEYSTDNVNWKTFADEDVVVDSEGVKRLNCVSDAVTGRYVRFTFDQDGLLMLDEIAVYAKAIPGGDYENNPDAGPSYNLVRGQQYTVSRSADYRSTAGLLTDGKYGQSGTKYDKNWTGFLHSNDNDSYNHLEVIFDMGASNSVSEIILSTRNDPANSLTPPQNLCFWASQNGKDWAKITEVDAPELSGSLQNLEMTWNGERDGFNSKVEGAQMVYARYIKATFDTPEQNAIYAYLDEIKIIGKRGKCSNAAEVMNEEGFYNVALGKPYTANPVQKSQEPDIGGKQLTDGIQGTIDVRDPAWVSFMQNYRTIESNATSKASLQSFIIDLQGTKSVTSVRTHLLAKEFSYQPWAVFTYASMDGETWVPLSRTTNVDMWAGGNYQWGWRCKAEKGDAIDLVDESIEAVAANYIRLDVEMLHTNMMDEIEVFGYDGVIDGAVLAENGRDLDNGRDYQKPGEDTAYIEDMVLCYNGWYGVDEESGMYNGDWNAQKYRPYLTYLDTSGKAQDKMFDAVCLLALTSRYGRAYNSDVAESPEPPQFEDWEWYLDKTFKEGGDVDELNKAAEIAAKELGDPNYKIKLVVMSPGIDRRNHKFGPINGKYYDMDMPDYYNPDVYAEWQDCCDWWYDEVLRRFGAGNYEYIDFVGFYWLSEQVGFTPAQVIYNTRKVHELGYKMFWIPFNYANGYMWGRDVGFDAIAYQPNHFFGEPLEIGSTSEVGNNYLDNVAYHANYGQIGLEMEFDGRAFESPHRYNQFLDYLNGAVKNGMDGDGAYRNWYQAVSAMGVAAASDKAEIRALYDYSYQLMQGTYTPKPLIEDFSGEIIKNEVGTGSSGGSTGGGSIGGGGSSGGGSVTPKPDDKPDPETPPTGDENYTWEETDDGYQLTDKDGEIVTGWAKVDGKWYYLNDNGIRQTGWQKVDNKWYYLKADGVMATGWLKLGNVWYFLNGSGVMQTGWLYNGGVWYYLYDWGGMANTSWVQVGNTWYYFRGNGAMMKGWLQQGSTWYYLKDSGAMATGWNWVGSKCYYFYGSGKMAANTTVGGYKLDASGAWVK